MWMLSYGLFFAFEALSSIKINYNKTELIPINLGQTKAHTMVVLSPLFLLLI
jgi:hypothetical protein